MERVGAKEVVQDNLFEVFHAESHRRRFPG